LLQIVTPKTSESEEYLSEDEEVVEEETVGCTVEDTDPGRVCDSTTLNLYRDFDLPVKKLRRREIKWMHMIKSWDKFVSRHYEKVSKGYVKYELKTEVHKRCHENSCVMSVVHGWFS
jgi:hypothetical protein